MFRGPLLVLAAGILSLLYSAPSRATELVLGTTGTVDGTNVGIFIAQERHLFEKEHLDVSWVAAGSSSKLVQQIIAGSINIGLAATDQTARAVSEGAALKIVGGTVRAAPFRLLARKGAHGWDQLKGQLISVGGVTDQTLYLFRIMARKNNIPDGSYDLIYAGTSPARYAQLESGSVAAAVLTNPLDIQALDDGFVDLGATADYVPDWSQNNLTVETGWAAKHRDELTAFLRAYKAAITYFFDPANKADVISILAKYSKSSPSVAAQLYEFYHTKPIIVPQLEISKAGIRAVVQSLVDLKQLDKAVTADALIDESFLRQAQ